jgi:hypothetical protein
MPRASWRGFLRLSLVSCPIYLSPATGLQRPWPAWRIFPRRSPRLAYRRQRSRSLPDRVWAGPRRSASANARTAAECARYCGFPDIGELVIGDHMGLALRLRQIAELDARHLLHLQQPRCDDPGVSCHDAALAVEQHRIGKSEFLDRCGYLDDLRFSGPGSWAVAAVSRRAPRVRHSARFRKITTRSSPSSARAPRRHCRLSTRR